MKNLRIQIIIKVIAFIVFSGNVYAQVPDLTFNAGTTMATYPATQFQITPVLINFEVANIGTLNALGGVSFQLSYDDLNLMYNATASTFPNVNWSCTAMTGGLACQFAGTFAQGSSNILSLAFDIGSTAPIMQYNINGSLVDNGSVEINTTNNSIATLIDLTAQVLPDLALVGGITPLNFTFTENNTTPQSVFYKVINNGGDAMQGVDFAVTYDNLNFALTGPTSAIPAGWNCVPTTGVITCSTGLNFPANAVVNFTFDFAILTLPAAPAGSYPNVLTGNLQDPSFNETNLTDNVFKSNVTINTVAAPSPDLSVALIDIDGNAGLTQLDFSVGTMVTQKVHYRVINSVAAASNGAKITLSYDPVAFSLTGTSIPGMWTCGPPVSGVVTCTDTNLINIGGTFDFFFDVTPISSTLLATTYAALDVTVSDTNNAEPPATLNDNNVSVPVSVVTAVLQTDLELKKFAKDVVGGTIITNILQDTQFVYAIQVNNLSVTAANTVVVTDNIPVGIEITSSLQSIGSWNCSIGVYVINLSQSVTCTRPSIAASQPSFNEIIYLDAFGRVSGPSPLTNTASVSSTESDLNSINNMGSAAIVVDPLVTVTNYDVTTVATLDTGFVFNEFGPQLLQGIQGSIKVLGVASSFTGPPLLKSKPQGKQLPVVALPGAASNVMMTIPIPAGVTYISHSIVGPNNFVCSYDSINNVVNCLAVALPADVTGQDGVFIVVQASSAPGTQVTFTASITADSGSNQNSTNDTNSASTFVIAGSPYELDLAITKSAQLIGSNINNSQFLVGQNFEYKLVVTNQLANIAQPGDVDISDVLPTGINLNAIPSSFGWDCSGSAGTTISCKNTTAIAANGGILELIIPVSSNAIGNYVNTANTGVTFITPAFENNLTDNTSTYTVSVVNALQPTTLSVTKDALVSGSPVTSVNSNSNYTYRINVTNTGSADAVNIVAVDVVPPGVNVNNATGIGWNCSNVAQQYTCVFPGPLTPGSSSLVDLNVLEATAVGTTQITNTVTVTSNNATTPQSASNIVSIVRPTFNVTVIQNPDPVEENMPFDLTVSIVNTGNNNLSNILVDNILPNGFSYIPPLAKAIPNCNQNGLVLSCFYTSPILPGASETLVIPIQAIGTVVNGTMYLNQTTISGAGITNPIVKNVFFSVNPSVVPQFDVSINKSASVTVVSPNTPFNYFMSITNVGVNDVTAVTVVDNLPAGVQLVSVNAPNWSCVGSIQISCTQNMLIAGATSDIILNVKSPNMNGTITNSAQVSIAESDSNIGNDVSQSSVNVMTGATGQPSFADLQLTKTTSSPTLISGEQYSWQIEVLNNGPDTAINVVVNDVLPTGFQFDSVIASTGNCQNTAVDISCQVPFIFNQDTAIITVTGTAVIDSGMLNSIATVMADTTDLVPGNNSGSVNVIVNPVPFFAADLAISINAGNSIDQGDISEFSINVLNNGPDKANPPDLNITVTGLLDSVSFNQGNDWSCQESGFVVSCHFNGTEINNGQMSSVGLTVSTSQLVLDAQDVVVVATVSTTETDVDSNLDNNTVTSIIGVSGTPTEGEIGDALRGALGSLGSSGDPILDNAIDAVSGYCELSYFTALEGLCDSLYNAALDGDRVAITTFLRQITPNQVIGQSTSVAEIAGAQFRNIGARLNQLRGGGGSGFSTAGLNARYGNGSIPLGMLAYLNQSEEETDGLTKIPDDFITPWGFFVNGSISMGKRDATGKELGFDFNTYGLTAGFDYRLDAKKVIGIALGYANFDSNVDGAAQLNSTGVTLTGYGSFYVNDNFYVDARISYGKPKFDQSRNINFTLGSTSIDRTAIGNTSANQYSFAVSAGYSFYKNAWNITPNASLSYVKTIIDSFTETGAGDFNVIYSEQQWDSLLWSAGLKVSKAISLKKGVITPQFDFDYNYESKNNGQDIIAHFINAPSDQLFIIATDSPDRTYGSAGLGLVYISANGKQAYINYRSVLGLAGFSRGTFNLGARFEF